MVFDPKSPTFVSVQQVNGFVTLCPGNTPVFPSNTCDHQRQYQLSQEVQASGTIGEFHYVGGLFFFDEKVHEQDPEALTVVLPTSALGFPAVIPGFPTTNVPGLGRMSLIGFQVVSGRQLLVGIEVGRGVRPDLSIGLISSTTSSSSRPASAIRTIKRRSS